MAKKARQARFGGMSAREMLDSEFPQAALVSEWSCPSQTLGAGFHADFLLDHWVMDVPAHVPPCNGKPAAHWL
jgi:hypothetical protein